VNLNKEQIITMIAQGIPGVQIAAALGVDESYISQLKADPEIQAEVSKQAASLTAADIAFDDLLQTAEQKALERIEKNLHFASLGQAMMAFRTLNGAKKRRDASLPGAANASTTINVNLTLPAQNIVNYITNTRNEIVEVEGKTMISATVSSLDSILAARAGTGKIPTGALPAITDVERAADRLDVLSVPRQQATRAPRRLPTELSVDIL
jgi:hypothetical protein